MTGDFGVGMDNRSPTVGKMTTPRHNSAGSAPSGHSTTTQSVLSSPTNGSTSITTKRFWPRCFRCGRFARCFSCGWNPATRLLLFFVCYGVFLAPVLVALAKEFSGMNLDKKQAHLILPLLHPGGPAFLIALSQWLGTLLILYFLYRMLGRRVGIKLHDKTLAKHKDDLLRLVYFGMTMAAVSGIASRIEEGVVNTETGLTFIPLTIAYCVFFTFIFELVKERDISLSVGLFENRIGLLVVFLGFCTCLLVLTALFLTAWQVSTSFFAMYTGVCLVGFLAHVAMFLPVVPGVPGRSYLHLHHWYWSVPLAHMCVFHTDVSMLAQAIFLAVHIHGVDCFGVEPLFYDTERRARHPSDFDWVLKEHSHDRRPYEDWVPKEDPDIEARIISRVLAKGGPLVENIDSDSSSMNGDDERDSLITRGGEDKA